MIRLDTLPLAPAKGPAADLESDAPRLDDTFIFALTDGAASTAQTTEETLTEVPVAEAEGPALDSKTPLYTASVSALHPQDATASKRQDGPRTDAAMSSAAMRSDLSKGPRSGRVQEESLSTQTALPQSSLRQASVGQDIAQAVPSASKNSEVKGPRHPSGQAATPQLGANETAQPQLKERLIEPARPHDAKAGGHTVPLATEAEHRLVAPIQAPLQPATSGESTAKNRTFAAPLDGSETPTTAALLRAAANPSHANSASWELPNQAPMPKRGTVDDAPMRPGATPHALNSVEMDVGKKPKTVPNLNPAPSPHDPAEPLPPARDYGRPIPLPPTQALGPTPPAPETETSQAALAVAPSAWPTLMTEDEADLRLFQTPDVGAPSTTPSGATTSLQHTATIHRLHPAPFTQQLAAAIAQTDGSTTEIRLDPEELGRVRITLSATENGMAVSVLSERPETNELLRRHLDELARDFQGLGYEDMSFSFGTGTDGSDDQPNGTHGGTQTAQTTDQPSQPMPTLVTVGGLDLRL